MLIIKAQPGFGRGRWVTDYEQEGAITVVTGGMVVIATDDCQVHLSKAEVDSIYRWTYGMDWEKPE